MFPGYGHQALFFSHMIPIRILTIIICLILLPLRLTPPPHSHFSSIIYHETEHRLKTKMHDRKNDSVESQDFSGKIYSPALSFEMEQIHPALDRRRQAGSLRKLEPFHKENMIDFSSNDYLGLAQSLEQNAIVEKVYQKLPSHLLGSTGSRLLTGDSKYAQTLEKRLAKWHHRPAALLCNSGYDANLAVLSTLALDCLVIMDELCHNSIQMGVRLSKGCTVKTFKHNNLQDLKRILIETRARFLIKPPLIVVESVYSMDGDLAPLKKILQTAFQHRACVVVDEAHGLGVFGGNGMGVLAEYGLEQHPALCKYVN